MVDMGKYNKESSGDETFFIPPTLDTATVRVSQDKQPDDGLIANEIDWGEGRSDLPTLDNGLYVHDDQTATIVVVDDDITGQIRIPNDALAPEQRPASPFEVHGTTLDYRNDRRNGSSREKKRPPIMMVASIVAALLIACFAIGFFSGLIELPGIISSPGNDGSPSGTPAGSEGPSTDSSKPGSPPRTSGADDAVQVENLADSAVREAFRNQVDEDGDGRLTTPELEGVRTLDLSDTTVSDIGDLSLLTNLETLDISGCSSLHDADFGLIPSLKELDAEGSGISDADFSQNQYLSDLKLDDSVVVTGLDATKLRQQWQIVSYTQRGYAGYGGDREGDWSAFYEYDDENRLISRKLSGSGVAGGSTFCEYVYDSSGNFISEIEYDGAGNFLSELRCTRDSKNISVERKSSDGSLVKGYYGTFDEQGRVSHISLSGSDFAVDYEYDYDDRLVSAHYHESGGEYSNDFEYSGGKLVLEDDAASPAARDIRYEYDDQGRCIARSVLSADGEQLIDVASFSYDDEGRLTCNEVDLGYDDHGNIVKRTFEFGGSQRGTSEISYRRVFTSKDSDDVYQPLETGDPALAPMEVLPCTVNLMAPQDALVRQSGPYVLRKI